METVLGLLGLAVFIVAVITLAASITWLVVKVSPGSPRDQAGLSSGHGTITFESDNGIPTGGDAILSVDGQPVTRSSDLTTLVGLKSPGQTVTLAVVRGSAKRTVKVKLTARPVQIGPGGG